MPFVDVVKQSRVCGSPQAPYDGKCVSDGLGWAKQDFGLVLITTNPGPLPPMGTGSVISGIYTVIATGNASVWPSGSVQGFVLNQVPYLTAAPPPPLAPSRDSPLVFQTYDSETNTLLAYVNCTSEVSDAA